jgi:hypothetical protein
MLRRKRYEVQVWRGVYSYCFGHYFPSIKSWLAGSFLDYPVVALNSYYCGRLVADPSFLSPEAIESASIAGKTQCQGTERADKALERQIEGAAHLEIRRSYGPNPRG